MPLQQELEEQIAQLSAELYGKLPQVTKDNTPPSPLDSLTEEKRQMVYQLRDRILKQQDGTETSGDNWYAKLLPNEDIETLMNQDITYYRYLNGFEWKMDVAAEKLKAMVEWRIREKPNEYTLESLKHVGPTKLIQVYGFDKQLHPVVVVNMRNLDKDKNWDSEENLALRFKYFVYITERVVERMSLVHPNIYQAVWIIDMDDCSIGLNIVKKMKDLFMQLGEYHAERLSGAIICNTGWTLSILWGFVKMFLTEASIRRYTFVKKGQKEELARVLSNVIDIHANGGNLLASLNGPVPDPFNPEKINKLEMMKQELKKLKSST